MAIVRPRLNDFHNVPLRQEDIDFAIPFLDSDIPLYVDPFLLWKSPSMQDNALHTSVVTSFNHLGKMFSKGNETDAIKTLINLTECDEVGLGNSGTRTGKRIGEKTAVEILSLFKNIPRISQDGFQHFEEIQLLIDNVSKDRISDITCCIIKSWLVDFTIQQCDRIGIPRNAVNLDLYDYKKQKFINEPVPLPINPVSGVPLLLTPKRWLRYVPWINYDDYFDNYYIRDIEKEYDGKKNRIEVLDYNRKNYDLVNKYTELKEKVTTDCKNDPLFTQIPVLSAKKKCEAILSLPTGKTDNADKKYEDLMVQILAHPCYIRIDFAQEQSRIDSGSQIRDLIFYNNREYEFLRDIYDTYDCRQIVFELKNVAELERNHINQLNRYLTEQFGKFGIIFTRKKPPKNIYQNTIDLWSGQRRCILVFDDSDLQLMTDVYESKQRLPIEVLKRKYVEFMRNCPS